MRTLCELFLLASPLLFGALAIFGWSEGWAALSIIVLSALVWVSLLMAWFYVGVEMLIDEEEKE